MPALDDLAGLRTPALVVDFDVVTSNMERMGSLLAQRDIALRPHVKTHKSPDLARLQLGHGAAGVTVATVAEASVFAAHGFEDIFVAYPVWADAETARLVRPILDTARLAVGVDSEASLGAWLDRLPDVRGRLDLMIEIDCGQHRTGVSPDAVVSLARACHEAGFAPRGVFTHGGHCYGGPGLVAGAAADEVRALADTKDRLGAAGLACEVVSAGSTPTVGRSGTGAVTEERPGVYVFNDRQQLILGSCTDEQIGAVVVTRVVSTSVADQFVVDAGSKALSSDSPPWVDGFGLVTEAGGASVTRLSEEHGVVECPGVSRPAVGDLVSIVPNHICSVVNLFAEMVVVQSGAVVDRWPVAARRA
jgi:D-serine deaminase-like pyridoxal phosphate-dependent protein